MNSLIAIYIAKRMQVLEKKDFGRKQYWSLVFSGLLMDADLISDILQLNSMVKSLGWKNWMPILAIISIVLSALFDGFCGYL